MVVGEVGERERCFSFLCLLGLGFMRKKTY